jgi:hypothetical protein
MEQFQCVHNLQNSTELIPPAPHLYTIHNIYHPAIMTEAASGEVSWTTECSRSCSFFVLYFSGRTQYHVKPFLVHHSKAQEIKKYSTYYCKVDPRQNDKVSEIKLFSFARPHMRAFYMSWFAFFVAFFIWFAIAPLLPEIAKTLDLNRQQVWTSNICSVAGTIFLRFINGPLCDKYSACIPMGFMLMFASIPCACTGLANSYAFLCVIRFFIGFGVSFQFFVVPCFIFCFCFSNCIADIPSETTHTSIFYLHYEGLDLRHVSVMDV